MTATSVMGTLAKNQKTDRQQEVIDILRRHVVRTQRELAEELRMRGYQVTQATVSRDIKELGLTKVPDGENAYRYAAPPQVQTDQTVDRMRRVFRDSVVGIDYSENLVLVRTLSGNAHAVASLIDQAGWTEVIGSVAGDDTILVIVKPKEAVPRLLDHLELMRN